MRFSGLSAWPLPAIYTREVSLLDIHHRQPAYCCFLKKFSGTRLLFHTVASIVPSAVRGLTIVFGMGTGVTPARIGTGNLFFCQDQDCSALRALTIPAPFANRTVPFRSRRFLAHVGLRSICLRLSVCKHTFGTAASNCLDKQTVHSNSLLLLP